MFLDQVVYDVLIEVAFLLVDRAQEGSTKLCKDPDSISRYLSRELHEVKRATSALCQKDLYTAVDLIDRGVAALSRQLLIQSDLPNFTKQQQEKKNDLSLLKSEEASLYEQKYYREAVETYFRPAHVKATEAFSNIELTVKDRFLAAKIQLTCTFYIHGGGKPQSLARSVTYTLCKLFDISQAKLKRAAGLQTVNAFTKATRKTIFKSRYLDDINYYHAYIQLVWSTLNVLEEHIQLYVRHNGVDKHVLEEMLNDLPDESSSRQRSTSILQELLDSSFAAGTDLLACDENIENASVLLHEFHINEKEDEDAENTEDCVGKQVVSAMGQLAVSMQIETWLMLWEKPDPEMSDSDYKALTIQQKYMLEKKHKVSDRKENHDKNLYFLYILNDIAESLEPLQEKLSKLDTVAENKVSRNIRTSYILHWTSFLAQQKLAATFQQLGAICLEKYLLFRLFLVVEERFVTSYSNKYVQLHNTSSSAEKSTMHQVSLKDVEEPVEETAEEGVEEQQEDCVENSIASLFGGSCESITYVEASMTEGKKETCSWKIVNVHKKEEISLTGSTTEEDSGVHEESCHAQGEGVESNNRFTDLLSPEIETQKECDEEENQADVISRKKKFLHMYVQKARKSDDGETATVIENFADFSYFDSEPAIAASPCPHEDLQTRTAEDNPANGNSNLDNTEEKQSMSDADQNMIPRMMRNFASSFKKVDDGKNESKKNQKFKQKLANLSPMGKLKFSFDARKVLDIGNKKSADCESSTDKKNEQVANKSRPKSFLSALKMEKKAKGEKKEEQVNDSLIESDDDEVVEDSNDNADDIDWDEWGVSADVSHEIEGDLSQPEVVEKIQKRESLV